jgi:actin-related protein
MAFKSIDKCDNDLKNSNLYGNIVLAGGSTLMPGFRERFESEIRGHAAHTADTDIKVFADLHRKNAAWIGGSMISSFSTFKDMLLTKEDYEAGDPTERSLAILKKSVWI